MDADAIAGLVARIVPAAPSARITEKRMDRPVRMIPSMAFPEASRHNQGSKSLTACLCHGELFPATGSFMHGGATIFLTPLE